MFIEHLPPTLPGTRTNRGEDGEEKRMEGERNTVTFRVSCFGIED